ncbi:hypothetical protein C2845_PM03G06410 [Panicum miliaceum]|uniref:DUF4283 domain-containing protein n=1 Tax=Panicum miliaceum TaxID=4540 RepID=A0A3L6T6P8_PANMI|nr:hypothetical protein C2845_PM03G06410 [Panicum miliaceum]
MASPPPPPPSPSSLSPKAAPFVPREVATPTVCPASMAEPGSNEAGPSIPSLRELCLEDMGSASSSYSTASSSSYAAAVEAILGVDSKGKDPALVADEVVSGRSTAEVAGAAGAAGAAAVGPSSPPPSSSRRRVEAPGEIMLVHRSQMQRRPSPESGGLRVQPRSSVMGAPRSLSGGSRVPPRTAELAIPRSRSPPRVQSSPPPPPRPEVVVIPRTETISRGEAVLSRALVAVIGGVRPNVSAAQVQLHIQELFGVQLGSLSVHLHRPEDFLIVFNAPADVLRVLNATYPPNTPFRLFFKPWRREAQAVVVEMDYLMRVALDGIPAHLWLLSTAQAALGPACDIVSMAPATVSKEDVSRFIVEARCVHPDLVPRERLVSLPDAPPSTRLLGYHVRLEILEARDLRTSQAGRLAGSGPPSGGSGAGVGGGAGGRCEHGSLHLSTEPTFSTNPPPERSRVSDPVSGPVLQRIQFPVAYDSLGEWLSVTRWMREASPLSVTDDTAVAAPAVVASAGPATGGAAPSTPLVLPPGVTISPAPTGTPDSRAPLGASPKLCPPAGTTPTTGEKEDLAGLARSLGDDATRDGSLVASAPSGQALEGLDPVDEFVSSIQSTTQESVLHVPPIRRRSKLADRPAMPWRSKRLAAKSKGQPACPYTRASNVLMKKWGVTGEDHPPDARALQDYEEVYGQPLSEDHFEALSEIVPLGPVPDSWESVLEA